MLENILVICKVLDTTDSKWGLLNVGIVFNMCSDHLQLSRHSMHISQRNQELAIWFTLDVCVNLIISRRVYSFQQSLRQLRHFLFKITPWHMEQ